MQSRFSLPLLFCLTYAGLAPPVVGRAQQQVHAASADELLRKAITEQQSGNIAAAIADYRRALTLRPEMVEARANLGAALAATGDLDGAIQEYTRALPKAPDKAAVRMNLALAYYKKADWKNAQAEFAKVHAERPGELNSAMLLAYCDVKLERAAEAVQLLQPLEPGQESNMDFEFVMGYALSEAGNLQAGLPRLEASARATHSVDAFVIAGSAHLHRREFKEARADLDEAVRLDPNFPGAQTLAGQARDALGDVDGARPAFEAALRQDPRDLMANLYLGTMRLKDRDLDGARPLLEMAVQLAPQMPQARLQWAKLNSMTGQYAEAARILEDLEKADPSWLDPHIELAAIYYKLHRPDDGQRERDLVQQMEAKEQKQGPSR